MAASIASSKQAAQPHMHICLVLSHRFPNRSSRKCEADLALFETVRGVQVDLFGY